MDAEGENCVRPPDCHSEPISEEYRVVYFYFVLLEILRFTQDDKLGFVYPIVGANCVRPPADFDVILFGRGFSPKTGTLRREQAPALLYYNRHFPEQGNHPPLREKIYCVRRERS